jgi:hypothetical protein
MLIFYQINRDDEIRICDRLVIKALIPCQKNISTQKFKLLGGVLRYNLYYSPTCYTIMILLVIYLHVNQN